MQGASKAPAAVARQKKEKPSWGKRLQNFKENSPYLLMILPAVLVVFLFNYLPIYGVLIAFQDFMPGDPILSSETCPAKRFGWASRISAVSLTTCSSGP